MMHDLLVNQTHLLPLSIYKTYSQILLFVVGMVTSILFAYLMLPFIYTSGDLLWYIVGMVIPLFPSILNMEELIL